MTRLIACALALLATTTSTRGADPSTRPSTREVGEPPVVEQGALTHRQVLSLMDVLGLRLESRVPWAIGPDSYELETWAKPDGKLKIFIIWAGSRMLPPFFYEGVAPASDKSPAATRRQKWEPGTRQSDLTREQYIAMMKALGLASEGEESRSNETWIKPLPDGRTLRIISEWNDRGRIRLNRIYFQGIPIR